MLGFLFDELGAAGEILVGEPEEHAGDGQLETGDLFGEAGDGEAEGLPEDLADEDAEDLESKNMSPDPGAPSQEEIDEHEVDHMPYRSWCEECVKGRGTGESHKTSKTESKVPVVAFDYLSERRS